MPAHRSEQCLRRGRSGSGMAKARPAGTAWIVAEGGGLPSRPPSPQAKPSSLAPWCPGRSSSGALHLDTRGQARSTACGTTADGMAAGGRCGSCGSIRWVKAWPDLAVARLTSATGYSSLREATRTAMPVAAITGVPSTGATKVTLKASTLAAMRIKVLGDGRGRSPFRCFRRTVMSNASC